jgi:hypothetical protein
MNKSQSRNELEVEAVRLYRDIDAMRSQLKNDVQAALNEADSGLCLPLDIDTIEAELQAELDFKGQPR